MRTKEEMIALVDETVDYYLENPRAVVPSGMGSTKCVYFDKSTGNMCAVGRCLAHPKYFTKRTELVEKVVNDLGDDIFKEEYQGYSVLFWKEIQGLHDERRNWEPGALSPLGQKEVGTLKRRIRDGYFEESAMNRGFTMG